MAASSTPAPRPILDAADGFSAWLAQKAYPLWWEAGADHEGGGFHDTLARSGAPAGTARRARVAARQAFSFSHAPRFGWRGPWRQAMQHGLDFLEAAHLRPDGLYRAHALADPPREGAELYDQAFVLLALASAGAAMEPRALSLLGRLRASAFGGFAEIEGHGLLANPNMHLFEAFLAWSEVVGGGPWPALARTQARLARNRLVDEQTSSIAETFDETWRPAERPDEREIWPGHQFEWAWLLIRHGEAASLPVALRLIETAERAGVDPRRNVAVGALDGALTLTDPTARLWPQTERLKANLAAARITGENRFWLDAEKAASGLAAYLEGSGLWRDRMTADGGFIDEPAPASSFYHIVGAIAELRRVCESPMAAPKARKGKVRPR